MYLLSFEDGGRIGTPYADCLVIFLGLEDPDGGAIDHAYSIWRETHVPPTTTLIVGRLDALTEFHSQRLESTGRLQGLDRLYGYEGTNNVILGGFDFTGIVKTVVSDQTQSEDITNIYNSIVRTFSDQQCEEGDVVIPAPPGTYFDKQSQRLSSHFIRAEALLHSTSCIELLALRLLNPFQKWLDLTPNKATGFVNIYVDTMAIWPVAEKLKQFHQYLNPSPSSLQVESFKSYDGLRKWSPSNRPAFVIISASTSGKLAQEVKEKIRSSSTEIWTLLALAPPSGAVQEQNSKYVSLVPRTLRGRPALDGLRASFEVDVTSPPLGTETISIVGERFLSQPAKPKRVRLIHKNLDDGTKDMLATIAKQEIVKVGRGGFDSQSRWALSFDLSALIQQACNVQSGRTESLLRSWLKNYSSPSPVAIIYPSPEGASAQEVAKAAKEFATRTVTILKEICPSGDIFTLSSDELALSSKPPPHDLSLCSVIVVCSILGNGFIFKQISASLRYRQPTGPRLYLALAALPESTSHFSQLKNDIAGVASDDSRYEFKCQYSLPIGRLDSATQWAAELDVLNELLEELRTHDLPIHWLERRIGVLEEAQLFPDDEVFLPSIHEKALPLSTGFLLWTGSSTISGTKYGGSVLLSIAALLQASRIAKSKSDDTSLRTGLFQHALICPESFTRFNDPVIQAALLRASYPPELNYSVCPEMSRDMARLLQKWIQYYADPAGAATGEFLLAIALDKLRLRENDLTTVLETATNKCSGWIYHLALIARKRRGIS